MKNLTYFGLRSVIKFGYKTLLLAINISLLPVCVVLWKAACKSAPCKTLPKIKVILARYKRKIAFIIIFASEH